MKGQEHKTILIKMYERLYSAFGPRQWWPGDTPFEVAVGAILTQNTNWSNVEKAIANLKKGKLLSARAIHGLDKGRLARLIRPAGYFNIKAKRLKAFVGFLVRQYGGSLRRMLKQNIHSVREELLAVHGVGPETADSIILYALEKPVFVIDAYTRRVLSRHGILSYDEPYDKYQELFHRTFETDSDGEESVTSFFNEFHALFVEVGKTYCRPREPLCEHCPLKEIRRIDTHAN
jgi:endonuclease-3 related protein